MERPFHTENLLKMMFAKLPQTPNRTQVPIGKTVLALKQVSGLGGRTGLSDCNIDIHQGEVIGLAGLEGSGQGVFLRLACGLKAPATGSVEVCGERLTGKNYHVFKQKGITFLPSNRLEEGLIGEMSIVEHFALQNESKGFLVPWTTSLKKAQKCINKFRIMGEPSSLATSLSGGNQQRLMLSFLPENPKLLLLENPTRGLDLESAHWIWQYLHGYIEQRTSIVFSSSELDEIILFADRILVFFEGKIIADVNSKNSNPEELGRAIAGKLS
jgi:simple sugar transport system ATP-binding protein